MANSIVRLQLNSSLLPVSAMLSTTEPSGQVAPAASGYTLTYVSGLTYQLTVPEACTGIYQVNALNSDGEDIGVGYVWIVADDTSTYLVGADYHSIRMRKDSTVLADLLDGGRLDVILDSILGDTNELQTDWKNGGRLDLLLDSVIGKTSLIGTGSAYTAQPVNGDGGLNTIVIGDDYLNANNRAFVWEFDAIPGFAIGVAQGRFGLRHPTSGVQDMLVAAPPSGITDIGGGKWRVVFEVGKSETQSLAPGHRDYSVEIRNGTDEVTIVRNNSPKTRVLLVDKHTHE